MIASRPNPEKRNIIIQRLSRAPWWILGIVLFVLVFYFQNSENETYQNLWRGVEEGIETTIRVTVFSYMAALAIGLLVAVLRRDSKSPIYNLLVYQPTTFFVEFIRGIPTLVLVYFFALGFVRAIVPPLNGLGSGLLDLNLPFDGFNDIARYFAEVTQRELSREFPPIYRAGVALTISYAAFLSEVFRAGIESVENGQWEAARSLGMNSRQSFLLIIFPQAFRNVLPPLANDFIAMLKESSLVSVVGVQDITLRARTIGTSEFVFFEQYYTIALTYLVITLSLSLMVRLLENYLNRSRRNSNH